MPCCHRLASKEKDLASACLCIVVYYCILLSYYLYIIQISGQKMQRAWTCNSEVDLSFNKRNEPRVDRFPSKAGWFAKFAAEWSVGFGPPILHRPCKRSALSWHTIQRQSLCFPVVKNQHPDCRCNRLAHRFPLLSVFEVRRIFVSPYPSV